MIYEINYYDYESHYRHLFKGKKQDNWEKFCEKLVLEIVKEYIEKTPDKKFYLTESDLFRLLSDKIEENGYQVVNGESYDLPPGDFGDELQKCNIPQEYKDLIKSKNKNFLYSTLNDIEEDQ